METVSVGSTRPHELYQKNLFLEKIVPPPPPYVINPREYTQICVGLLPYM